MTQHQLSAVGDFQFVLRLNSMMSNAEQFTQFGPFPTFEAALAYHDAEKVETYFEEGPSPFTDKPVRYGKSFKKGGPLEWYNPLKDSERAGKPYYEQGIFEVLVGVNNIIKGEPVIIW